MNRRISYLDGHRGLAIVLVMLFHAYVRWADLVPYGNQFASFPLFEYGWVGVQLFFLISGFVILMTLEKCTTIQSFLYRRWLRLFPAMLICSLLIFGSAGFFWERPAGAPTLESLLPGLTFIGQSFWESVLKRPIKPLEGSFWSIYAEFKFYIFASAIYYWKGRKYLFILLISAFLLSVLSSIAATQIGGAALKQLDAVVNSLSFQHFGWFASGAAFYVYHKSSSRRWLWLAISMAVASSIALKGFQFGPIAAAILVFLAFAGPILVPALQKPLNSRILQFYGFISYPLYLIHENMMISIIAKLGGHTNSALFIFLPAVAIALLSLMAFILAKYIEPYAKTGLTNLLGYIPQKTT
jgi:peptidoglycan/LPS O-acetylase OafA/YrhL